jgi:hypothetical protein
MDAVGVRRYDEIQKGGFPERRWQEKRLVKRQEAVASVNDVG